MSQPQRSASNRPDDAEDAVRTLRRYHEGVLALAERRAETRFIIDGAPRHPELILPVEPAFAAADDLLLTVPDEPSWVWQATLTPSPIARPEIEEAVDRWSAYHGRCPPRTVWVRASLDGLKLQGLLGEHPVWRGVDLSTHNLVRDVEPRFIRRLNADRALLTRACKNHGPVDVPEPLAVGVDPLGIDVRARFGIVRLEFPDHVIAHTPEQLDRAVEFILGTRAWADHPTGASEPGSWHRPPER